MSFEKRMTEFAGLPVVDFPEFPYGLLPDVDPGAVAWRIGIDGTYAAMGKNHPDSIAGTFAGFLHRVDPAKVRALIFGMAGSDVEHDAGDGAKLLLEHAERFPALRALFLGELLSEESDVAYLLAAELDPVLAAFPAIEVLGVRGTYIDYLPTAVKGAAARLAPTSHHALRRLVLESGGLEPQTVRNILASDLPKLEHLELYLGDPHYGGDTAVADLAPLLSGEVFPELRSLGLRDSMIQDEIAAALAYAPIVARLEALDLSLGALSDEGMAALLAGQPLTHLKKLDLHYHFLSGAMMARVHAALPGVEVDLSEQQEPHHGGERYVAVSE
jgi:hypothetical protein